MLIKSASGKWCLACSIADERNETISGRGKIHPRPSFCLLHNRVIPSASGCPFWGQFPQSITAVLRVLFGTALQQRAVLCSLGHSLPRANRKPGSLGLPLPTRVPLPTGCKKEELCLRSPSASGSKLRSSQLLKTTGYTHRCLQRSAT